MKKNTLRRLSALLAASVMTVVCGATNAFANDEEASLKLTSSDGVAGQSVVVNLVLETGDICTGYDVDVEFDDRLELKSVGGVLVTETIGNVATVINLTTDVFEDNTPVSSLTFVVPEDADEGDSYDIRVSRIGKITSENGYIENVTATGTTINVLESVKKVANHMVYVTNQNGVEVSKVGLRGDADMDGKIDLYDAIRVAVKMSNKTAKRSYYDPIGDYFADVNGDGAVNLYDAIAISRYMRSSDKSNAWGTII